MVLEDEPAVTVARPVLSLTLYLGDPMPWAWEGARAVLTQFFQMVPTQELTHFATSVRPTYVPITGADMAKVVHDLALPWSQGAPRHLFWLRIVDDATSASLGFSYREVDSRVQGRCGLVELTFPHFFDPLSVLRLALEIADAWPLLAGVAGYSVSWNPREAAVGMSASFGLCRRYLGLDLADPDALAWFVPRALPGTNWLTLIGRTHATTLDLDLAQLVGHPFSGPISVHERLHAIGLQAGDHPVLGDLNGLVYPSAYAEVARLLAPHVVRDPPPFLGEPWQDERELTARYYRRFLEPENWR